MCSEPIVLASPRGFLGQVSEVRMGTSGLWLVKFQTEQTCLRAAEFCVCKHTFCLLDALKAELRTGEKTPCR